MRLRMPQPPTSPVLLLRRRISGRTNAAVPDTVLLTAYGGPMTITQTGTVIDRKLIEGTLRIAAADVVVRDSRIRFHSQWSVDAEGAANLTIEYCDISGPGRSGDSNAAILGSCMFLRNDISGSGNGIVLTGGAITVWGNYVHDLADAAGDPHYDGIVLQAAKTGS
jgi:hypothetical protein